MTHALNEVKNYGDVDYYYCKDKRKMWLYLSIAAFGCQSKQVTSLSKNYVIK